jgi:hypothetical protein
MLLKAYFSLCGLFSNSDNSKTIEQFMYAIGHFFLTEFGFGNLISF